MKKAAVRIPNETGLHARPASMLVDMASSYDSDMEIVYNGRDVNAKSIMGVMSLGISQDAEIIIQAKGEDEEEAVAAIVELVEDGFGEE